MMRLSLSPLVIDQHISEILSHLSEHSNLVLVATPGAGKTTRVPPALIHSDLFSEKKVLMLEPRRLAARASAQRIADEQGWTLGEEVGYRVRFEKRVGPKTRLEVLTEALLNRRLQSDPLLKDVGAVILDEFHERHWHSDIALSLLYELQSLSRPDLKIIVMSATIDADKVARFLNDCPIVHVKSPQHPVQIEYSRTPLTPTSEAVTETLTETLRDLMLEKKKRLGDVLAFFPGAGEIRRVQENLSHLATQKEFELVALHGNLTLGEQDNALKKSSRPKVVLATNIAETSLTIDGVATVVDSGLARVMQTSSSGLKRLQLTRISRASATQRTGRAGRQGPGLSYRLWNKMDEASMPPFEKPEILRTDLSEILILLASLGIQNTEGFSWYEAPPVTSIKEAKQLLELLNLVKEQGELTSLGKKVANLPVEPRLGTLLTLGAESGFGRQATYLAALLSEKDVLYKPDVFRSYSNVESDPLLRLHLLEEYLQGHKPKDGFDTFTARQVKKVSEQLYPLTKEFETKEASDNDLKKLLLRVYPDRVAKRRKGQRTQARLVGGKGVELSGKSSLEKSELFLAIETIELGQDRRTKQLVSQASEVQVSWLREFFPERLATKDSVVIDEEKEQIFAQTSLCYLDLPLEEGSLKKPTSEQAHEALVQLATAKWSQILSHQQELANWFSRVEFARKYLPDERWPEICHEQIQEVLTQACYGESRFQNVLDKRLLPFFNLLLSDSQQSLLEKEAPSSLQVPSGQRHKVHYPDERPPYMEVRIQEVFGWTQSPQLVRGQVSLLMHLLGPNYRPVQVTSDLASFWREGYDEVRKELRARYPKHSWPDDPLNARPEAKGSRRK